MKQDKISFLFHNLLNDVSLVRNALSFVLAGKAGKCRPQIKPYLQESLEKCGDLVKKITALRKKLELED